MATLAVGVLANMMTSAIFFFAAPTDSTQVAIAGILSGLAMLPFTDTFPYLFEKINTYRSHTMDLREHVQDKHTASQKAIQRAQQGKADQDVLAFFRNELEKAKAEGNAEAIKSLKINIAALIIDIAKNEAEQSVWRPMYAESIELSEQVLEFFQDDETAKANKQAAEAWLAHRTSQLQKQEEAEFLSKMEVRPGTHGRAPAPPSDGLTEEERARRMLLDDDDDDDDGKEEL